MFSLKTKSFGKINFIMGVYVQTNTTQELYKLPLWHNSLLSSYPLFFPELNNNGINLVGDLLTDTGNIITKKELLNKTK